VVKDAMPSAAQTSTFALLAALVAIGVTLAGCGGSKSTAPSSTSGARDQWGTLWLCRPGATNDPCTSDLATTVVTGRGATHIERAAPARDPRIDCFYVYPTVSGQTTINANLDVGFRESEIAVAQASRFSQVCRVYAPVYRQITLSALAHPRSITRAHALIAYRGVLDAFRDYLAHYNGGRGIVFIGHSQGATILIRLLQQEVDRRPAVRRRLVSALLLGGNVRVPKGRTVGGDFAHLPACAASRETGCVIAYSSFTGTPPKNSQFGRTTSDAGVNLLAPHNPASNLRIMCVNPAAPAGGSALLDPYIPALVLAFLPAGSAPSVKTPWVAFPDEYTARCESSGNATWLQITHVAGSADKHHLLTRLRDPTLGLHALDVTIALGNLVQLVRDEAAAYAG
jgi:hypothetical protein